MTTDLGSRLERFLDDLVTAGRFASRDEAIRFAVGLLEEEETKFTKLDGEIRQGLESLDRGEGLDASEVRRRLADRRHGAGAAA